MVLVRVLRRRWVALVVPVTVAAALSAAMFASASSNHVARVIVRSGDGSGAALLSDARFVLSSAGAYRRIAPSPGEAAALDRLRVQLVDPALVEIVVSSSNPATAEAVARAAAELVLDERAAATARDDATLLEQLDEAIAAHGESVSEAEAALASARGSNRDQLVRALGDARDALSEARSARVMAELAAVRRVASAAQGEFELARLDAQRAEHRDRPPDGGARDAGARRARAGVRLPAPRRRPLERVALTLLAHASARTPVIGIVAAVEAPDVNGRCVELTRLMALHSARPTLLVEATTRDGSPLAASMEIDPRPGLVDVVDDQARRRKAAHEVVRPTPDPRLWVMTSGAAVPSTTSLPAAALAEVIEDLRQSTWATARRVLDIRDDSGTVPDSPRANDALVSVSTAPPAQASPEDAPLLPFNEGPPRGESLGIGADLPLPPLPRSPAQEEQRRAPAGLVVLIAPPLDDRCDGDVVVTQCDMVVLLVHGGDVTSDAVADAAERVGRGRLLGTVLIEQGHGRRR
jgi:hypothetical protein